MRHIGMHISISGGVHKSLRRAKILDISTVQIFLKNARKWDSPQYKNEEIEKFYIEKKSINDLKLFAHSSYLINLGNKDSALKVFEALVDEMNRAESLGIEYLVLHPGSQKGEGESEAIRRIAYSLDKVFHATGNTRVKVLLETTAGMGNDLGYRFEHLRDIMRISGYSDRIFVCLDTCHIFAAGYNILDEENYKKVIFDFDRIIGLDKLKLIHLNDSKTIFGSRIDRHEHIGIGYIGDAGFRLILNDKRLKHIPLILETPKIIGELNSDIILKDIPLLLEKSRRFGISSTDTIFKDIPHVINKTKTVGISVSENILKKGMGVFEKAESYINAIKNAIKFRDFPKLYDKSVELGVAVTDNIVKDSLRIFEDAKLSVYDVDNMNLEKVHSLIDDDQVC